jgi:hypothetical protein
VRALTRLCDSAIALCAEFAPAPAPSATALSRSRSLSVPERLARSRVEADQRGILAGHLLRQEELHHDEHAEQEDDAENERRQGVDESRPVVDTALAAIACHCHTT